MDLGALRRDGYVVLRGVVPESLLAAADAEIDDLLATDPPPGDRRGAHHWFLPPAAIPACERALTESPAWELARSAVAPGELALAFDHVQIALNLPPLDHIPGGPHIDGHGHGGAMPFSFSLLAGIFVTDQMDGLCGQLWVWPGSHLDHGRLFRERGTRVLEANGGHAGMLDPPVVFGDPVPVHGRRGDLLLASYFLGHNHGGNTSPRVRRMLYYRLRRTDHVDRWEDVFRDPLIEIAEIPGTS